MHPTRQRSDCVITRCMSSTYQISTTCLAAHAVQLFPVRTHYACDIRSRPVLQPSLEMSSDSALQAESQVHQAQRTPSRAKKEVHEYRALDLEMALMPRRLISRRFDDADRLQDRSTLEPPQRHSAKVGLRHSRWIRKMNRSIS